MMALVDASGTGEHAPGHVDDQLAPERVGEAPQHALAHVDDPLAVRRVDGASPSRQPVGEQPQHAARHVRARNQVAAERTIGAEFMRGKREEARSKVAQKA
jgi:hypothetical protein